MGHSLTSVSECGKGDSKPPHDEEKSSEGSDGTEPFEAESGEEIEAPAEANGPDEKGRRGIGCFDPGGTETPSENHRRMDEMVEDGGAPNVSRSRTTRREMVRDRPVGTERTEDHR